MTMNDGASRLPGLPASTSLCCFFSRYPTGVNRLRKPEILRTIGPMVRCARGLASSSSRMVPVVPRLDAEAVGHVLAGPGHPEADPNDDEEDQRRTVNTASN